MISKLLFFFLFGKSTVYHPNSSYLQEQQRVFKAGENETNPLSSPKETEAGKPCVQSQPTLQGKP